MIFLLPDMKNLFHTRLPSLALLLLFLVYAGSVSLFYHSHEINGIRVTHSHPFNDSAGKHSHSVESLLLIQLLSQITVTASILFLILILAGDTFQIIQTATKTSLSVAFPLPFGVNKAPPSFFLQ